MNVLTGAGLVRVVRTRRVRAADDLRCLLLHARIPRDEVRRFWAEVQELSRQFGQIPRSGDEVFGFAAGLYPVDAPTLPGPGADQ